MPQRIIMWQRGSHALVGAAALGAVVVAGVDAQPRQPLVREEVGVPHSVNNPPPLSTCPARDGPKSRGSTLEI